MEPSRLVLYVLVRLLRPTSPVFPRSQGAGGRGPGAKYPGGPLKPPKSLQSSLDPLKPPLAPGHTRLAGTISVGRLSLRARHVVAGQVGSRNLSPASPSHSITHCQKTFITQTPPSILELAKLATVLKRRLTVEFGGYYGFLTFAQFFCTIASAVPAGLSNSPDSGSSFTADS